MPPVRLLLLAVLAVFAMSTVPVLVKSTIANETTIGIARLAVAVPVVSVALLWFGAWREIKVKDVAALAAIGLAFALHWYLYFVSIKLATAAIAATAIATYGVQYLLLAWLFNNEKIGWVEGLAILACFGGCLVVTPELSWSNDIAKGVGIGLVSAFFYACLPIMHQRARQMSNLTRTWGQFSFALLCFLPLWPLSDWELREVDWPLLLTLGILCTLIAHGLWVKVSTELPALFTGVAYYLYVPLAMLQSWLILDEEMTTTKLVGAAMILAASTGVTIYRARQYA